MHDGTANSVRTWEFSKALCTCGASLCVHLGKVDPAKLLPVTSCSQEVSILAVIQPGAFGITGWSHGKCCIIALGQKLPSFSANSFRLHTIASKLDGAAQLARARALPAIPGSRLSRGIGVREGSSHAVLMLLPV